MRKFGPIEETDGVLALGKPCAACGKAFAQGQCFGLVGVGPGDDEEEQAKARAGRPYNAVAVPVHWACATGEVA